MQPQTNLRLGPAHRILLNVLYGEADCSSQARAAEVGLRLLAEAILAHRLACGRPDPRVKTLLAALNAAAHEAHPQAVPWYRLRLGSGQLQRWTESGKYEDLATGTELPQKRL